MCGIAGVIRRDRGLLDPSFASKLIHRGPDDRGWLVFDEVRVQKGDAAPGPLSGRLLFWHQRLSIIDLSKTGWQPMSSADGRHHIVFNGEIYNFLELRGELEETGARFVSRSDTEVLLQGYARWGAGLLRKLVGMFAFAVLDVQERKVFLARDCFGIKPLYWAHYRDGFAFASEIKALLELPGVSRQAQPQRVYEFLRNGVTNVADGTTFFAGISQLPAAHFLEIRIDELRALQPRRYWQVDLAARSDCSLAEASERVRALFLRSVNIHLRSDVPVAGTLSGGIDSSCIVAAMRHVHPMSPIDTFSLVVDDPDIGEERYIDIVQCASSTASHKVRLTAEELFDDIDRLVYAQDEPFGGTSIYAEYRIHQQVAECGRKVILVGDGGDEIFGGYQPVIGARIASLLARGRIDLAMRIAVAAHRHGGTPYRPMLATAKDFLLSRTQQTWLSKIRGGGFSSAWLSETWFSARDVVAPDGHIRGSDKLRQHLLESLSHSALPTHLHCQDRNAMAHSVETRQPFLTTEMVEFVYSLPEEYIMSGSAVTKSLLRNAMWDLLPREIAERRDKIGFAVDEDVLLKQRAEWVEDLLLSEVASRTTPIVARHAVAYWRDVVRGDRPYSCVVWRWLSLVLWARTFNVEFA